jgi:hypothetical protein
VKDIVRDPLTEGTPSRFNHPGFVTSPWACGGVGSRVATRMTKISYAGYRFPPETR